MLEKNDDSLVTPTYKIIIMVLAVTDSSSLTVQLSDTSHSTCYSNSHIDNAPLPLIIFTINLSIANIRITNIYLSG